MSRLLESIYLRDGQFRNLPNHLRRMKESTQALFGKEISGTFEDWISKEDVPQHGLFKCRIIYQQDIEQVQFIPYQAKQVRSLKLVTDDSISYSHKFLDRDNLLRLFDQRGDADDIIIVKEQMVTDATYANLIFKKNESWYTPSSCLLKGTMRENLLQANRIEEINITVNDLPEYTGCKLINSMLGMEAEEILMSSIVH